MTNFLIPFSVAFNSMADGQLFIASDLLTSISHLLPPRVNGAPSPFTYAQMTFFSIVDRNPIRLGTNHVSGIYCWINMFNGKCYIGKANNLYLRLSNYFQKGYIQRTLLSSYFSRAISKYGLESFALVILEFNPANLAKAEQYWIDLIKPEYNQQLNVLSSGGGKTPQFKTDRSGPNNSFFGKQHSIETKAILRDSALARPTPNKPGYTFTIIDTVLDITTQYPSTRKGVELKMFHFLMGWSQPFIVQRINKGVSKLYLNRYLIHVDKPTN